MSSVVLVKSVKNCICSGLAVVTLFGKNISYCVGVARSQGIDELVVADDEVNVYYKVKVLDDGFLSAGGEHEHSVVYKHLSRTGELKIEGAVSYRVRHTSYNVGDKGCEQFAFANILNRIGKGLSLYFTGMYPVITGLCNRKNVGYYSDCINAFTGHILLFAVDSYGYHLFVRNAAAELINKVEHGVIRKIVDNGGVSEINISVRLVTASHKGLSCIHRNVAKTADGHDYYRCDKDTLHKTDYCAENYGGYASAVADSTRKTCEEFVYEEGDESEEIEEYDEKNGGKDYSHDHHHKDRCGRSIDLGEHRLNQLGHRIYKTGEVGIKKGVYLLLAAARTCGFDNQS